MSNPAAFLQREHQQLKKENKELQEEVQNLRNFVAALTNLYEAADGFQDDSELFPTLRTILLQAMHILNAPDGSLLLLDDETGELVFVIVEGNLKDKLTNHRIPGDEGIAGWVVINQKATLVRNTGTDARFSNRTDTSFTFKTQSIAAAPLLGDRKVYGVIEVLNQPGTEPFSDNDLALLQLLCRAAGEALALIDRLAQPE
jgi:GAF domain-containing protein